MNKSKKLGLGPCYVTMLEYGTRTTLFGEIVRFDGGGNPVVVFEDGRERTCLRCDVGSVTVRGKICPPAPPPPEPDTVFSAKAIGLPPDLFEPGPLAPLCDLQAAVHQLSIRKGWYDDRDGSDPNVHITMLSLIASEVYEAIEEIRDGGRVNYSGDGGKPEGVGPELADVLIRLLDYAEFCGIDLGEQLVEKYAYNKSRPARHGGKLA